MTLMNSLVESIKSIQKYNDYHSSTVVLLLYVFYLKFKVLTKENTEMFGACLLVYT